MLLVEPSVHPGPLLLDVLDAQARDDTALRYPAIGDLATAVVALSDRLGSPVLWPVGSSAHRLLGAVELVTAGKLELIGWSGRVDGRGVLLVTTVALSTVELSAAGRLARSCGAKAVHACAIDPLRITLADGLDSFHVLSQPLRRPARRSA